MTNGESDEQPWLLATRARNASDPRAVPNAGGRQTHHASCIYASQCSVFIEPESTILPYIR